MKESTRIFMEKQLAENCARVAREARGDYGQPIHIVFDESKATHRIENGEIVPKEIEK